MSQPPCVACKERESIPYQGGLCGPCRRRRHEHLTPALAERLAELADETSDDLASADRDSALQLRGMAIKLRSRTRGHWYLSDHQREIASQLVFGYAQAHEQDHGVVDIELEQLYRRLTHVDRRTGLGPPWDDRLDT